MEKSASTWKDRPRWAKRLQESLHTVLSKTTSIEPIGKLGMRLFGMTQIGIKPLVCSHCRDHPAGKGSVPFEKSVSELEQGAKKDCVICLIAFNALSEFQGEDFQIQDVTSVQITPHLNELYPGDSFSLQVRCGEVVEETENAADDGSDDTSSSTSSSSDLSSTHGGPPAGRLRRWRPPGWRHLQRRIHERRSLSISSLEPDSDEAFEDDSFEDGESNGSDKASLESSVDSSDDDIVIETYQPIDCDIRISNYQVERNISSDPLSETCLEVIREWIRDCTASHPNCLQPSRMELPARLVDLGEGNKSPMKIVAAQSVAPSSGRERLKYASLTHCWGGSIPQSTTKDRLKEREMQLLEEELPPNFRDAIRVTRALRIRYLWIDSLCIVQDDTDDWASESMKMADVYKGSFIVISAARSPGSTTGFLGPGQQHKTVLSRQVDGKPLIVNAHRFLNHGDSERVGPVQAEKCLIFTRAWCYQERLLATRVLYFTPSEVAFECMTAQWCECSVFDDDHGKSSFRRHLWRVRESKSNLTDADFVELWTSIVEAYSRLVLTYENDRLSALSGIAHTLQTPQVRSGRYFAGLWERCVIQQLAWYTLHPSCRPAGYVAPTFSWASVTSRVLFRGRRIDAEYCRLVTGHCDLDTRDPFGRLREGSSITLQGTLHKLDFEKFNPVRRWGHYTYPANRSRHFSFSFDLKEDDDQVKTLSSLYFFALFEHQKDLCALVLQETETKGRFRRVGYADGSPPRGWFAPQLDGQPAVGEVITVI